VSLPPLLVACIGNIFFGDDAFGVEVAKLLVGRFDPARVRVVDFGTRGFDLALALTAGHHGAILVDAVRRGGEPGTLYVIEPDVPTGGVPPEAHGLHPAQAMALARTMGEVCPWLRVVGCEAQAAEEEDEPTMGLSGPVAAALPEAVKLIESLVVAYLDGHPGPC
jgi:hydrogenase maturation protease